MRFVKSRSQQCSIINLLEVFEPCRYVFSKLDSITMHLHHQFGSDGVARARPTHVAFSILPFFGTKHILYLFMVPRINFYSTGYSSNSRRPGSSGYSVLASICFISRRQFQFRRILRTRSFPFAFTCLPNARSS